MYRINQSSQNSISGFSFRASNACNITMTTLQYEKSIHNTEFKEYMAAVNCRQHTLC